MNNKKAQAGLEYLMTYGWAIVLVATVIGALVLVVSEPVSDGTFRISDPTGFLLKGSQIAGDKAIVKLQNITGGEIEIQSLQASGYAGCTINGGTPQGIKIGSGGEILIECYIAQGGSKTVSVDYKGQAGTGTTQTLDITGSAGTITPMGPVGEYICDDGIDNDGDTLIDCQDPNCHGTQGTGGTCEYAEELTCDDFFDNDGDGLPDCQDTDCEQDEYCQLPTSSTIVYMASSEHSGGAFGGRAGIDSWCASNKPSNLPASCENIHALVSVNSSDEIRDMPSVYGYPSDKPLYWWNNSTQEAVMLAGDWPDMLDGEILIAQEDGTGLTYGGGEGYVFTGSMSNGSVTDNCNGFTSGANQIRSGQGEPGTRTSYWMYTNYHVAHCTYSMDIRCVAECEDVTVAEPETCSEAECQAKCGGTCGADGECVDGTSCCGYESGGRCWYVSEHGESCEEICALHGGCDGSGWTDPGCSIQSHFFPCGACYANSSTVFPGYDDPSHCFQGTGIATCAASSTTIERLCRCVE